MLLLTVSAAAADLFPVSETQLDGETRSGYMDIQGNRQVNPIYAETGVFDDCGLAVVKNLNGETGLVDRNGKEIVSCRETPINVLFSDTMAVFEYANHSVYFTLDGTEIGTYQGAKGFFSEEGLLCVQRNGKWGYVNQNGELIIPAKYEKASPFVNGYALVQQDTQYGFLTAGAVFTELPAEPANWEVQEGGLAVLNGVDGLDVYSLSQRRYLTFTGYDSIENFDKGYAIVQKENQRGILNASGQESVPLQYRYLSYMGEGVYAVRDAAGDSKAIEVSGATVYAMEGYTGGFEPFAFGLSWHGLPDGTIVFFNKNGAPRGKAILADSAEMVGEGVAKITLDREVSYIRLSDGAVLYTPKRQYSLDNGVTVETRIYEKYLGMNPDGSEYGWHLQYPVLQGMADTTVQDKINTAIEGFFLNGTGKTALEGSYGIRFCGRVMVVSADAVSGQGNGAVLWNDSILLDYKTGETYTLPKDLFYDGYEQVLKRILPDTIPFNRYCAPQLTPEGILYHVNYPQTTEKAAYSDTYLISFSDFGESLNRQSACFLAMQQNATDPALRDVPENHWAYAEIQAVQEAGWMKGSNGYFYPANTITAADAIVAINRALQIPERAMVGTNISAWYAGAWGGAMAYGLLDGMETLTPTENLTRADMMQILYHALYETGEINTAVLNAFSDAEKIPENRKAAAAFCVANGLMSGTDGALLPDKTLTRAEFAKIIYTAFSK